MPTIKDSLSRHAHFIEQYKNGQVNSFAPFLRRVATSLRAELLKTNTVVSQSRIETKLEFVDELIKAEFVAYTDQLTEQIELFAVSEAAFVAETASAVSGVSFVLPAPVQLVAAVNARPFNNKLLKDYLKEFSKEQAKAVRNAVALGFYEGQPTAEIVRGIIGTKARGFKDGTLNVSRTSAERMVRTALAHTSAVARNKTYEANEDLVSHYEWVSTLDGNTSDVCKKRDGKVYVTGKGKLPPAHPNCRSTTAPLFKSDVKTVNGKLVKLDQGGTRASIDGQVDADLNYGEWLAKQSKSFQIDVLGKQKTELFRKGGLTIDKFINDKERTLTLDELKSKYPRSWLKAGI